MKVKIIIIIFVCGLSRFAIAQNGQTNDVVDSPLPIAGGSGTGSSNFVQNHRSFGPGLNHPDLAKNHFDSHGLTNGASPSRRTNEFNADGKTNGFSSGGITNKFDGRFTNDFGFRHDLTNRAKPHGYGTNAHALPVNPGSTSSMPTIGPAARTNSYHDPYPVDPRVKGTNPP